MSANKNLWMVVAKREIITKLTDKAFVISTVFMTAAIAIGVGVLIFMNSGPSTTKVAVTSADAATVVSAMSKPDSTWEPLKVASADDAVAAVRDGDVDAALERKTGGWQVLVKRVDGSSASTVNKISAAVASAMAEANAKAAGIDPATLTKGSAVSVVTTSGEQPENQFVAYMTGIAFAVLFYMTALLFGMQIAASVAKEKESRVIEILTAAVPTRQLLMGKILGNSLLAFAQVALYLGIALVGLSFTSFSSLLPSLATGSGWFVLFFITGFLALSTLWVAAGAMATKFEDLQQTANPLILVLVASYMLAFFAKDTLQVALSYVPIISSILMPMRLVAGTAQWWEAVIALVLNVAFTVVAVRFGAALYRRGVLQTGGVTKWSSAFRKAA